MANELFQELMKNQLSANNSQIASIKNLFGMVKNQSNPQAFLQMIAGQNPQISQVLQMVNGSGMTAKNLFYKMAQQRGVDPQQVLEILK